MFAISGLTNFDYNLGSNPSAITQMWITFLPLKNWTIRIGHMGTLPTQQRPLPPTANGQFETWSESQIPGQALNLKINYDGNLLKAGVGVAYRKGGIEYSGRVGITNAFIVSGWYSEWNKEWGVATTISTGPVYNVLVIKNNLIANILCIKLPYNLTLYSDNGYEFKTSQLVRSETGILLNFDSKLIKGLGGFGWEYSRPAPGYFLLNQLKVYLFLHL